MTDYEDYEDYDIEDTVQRISIASRYRFRRRHGPSTAIPTNAAYLPRPVGSHRSAISFGTRNLG